MYLARVCSTTSCGQRRAAAARRAVPAGRRRGQPVADELLVERRLRAARLPLVGGPEAGRVRGQHLVGQRPASVAVEAELELGVRQDDAALAGDVAGAGVDGERQLPQLGGDLGADLAGDLLVGDVLVVLADLGLGRRGEDRRGQLGAVDQALGQRQAADRAGLLVLREAGAGRGSRGPRTPPGPSAADGRPGCGPPSRRGRRRAARWRARGWAPGRRAGRTTTATAG